MKTSAETQRRLLVERLGSLSQVQEWADGHIAQLGEPPCWLIAVSMAKSMDDAAAALGDCPGTADAMVVWRAVTREWLELLQQEPERDTDIARRLYHIGMQGQAPVSGIDAELMSFWDAIDLARDGVWGSRETERRRLRGFLSRWGKGGTAQPGVAADAASPHR